MEKKAHYLSALTSGIEWNCRLEKENNEGNYSKLIR